VQGGHKEVHLLLNNFDVKRTHPPAIGAKDPNKGRFGAAAVEEN